jgi:hypothetical protein
MEGTFKDFENDFSCNTIEEWIEHLGEVELTYTGSVDCITCGEPVTLNWTGKLKNGKLFPYALCEGCKAQ